MGNWIDKTIGYFSPKRGLARARARNAMRMYEGATAGRRTTSFRGRATSANTEIAQGIGNLRDRARDLVRNTPHGPRLLDIMCSHIIGTGIRPVSATGKDKLDDRIERLWKDWQDAAGIEGLLSFYAQQELGVRSMIQDGEVVLRMIDQRLKDAPTAVQMQIQMLEGDHIDTTRDGVTGALPQELAALAPETTRTRIGVGLGEFDRRTGLWLYPYHPGEQTTAITASDIYTSKFVKADELIHLYSMKRPGQVRGISWMAPMIMTARDIADLMDAIVVKSKIEACFAGFVTTQGDDGDVFEESGLPQDTSLSNPNALMSTLEPGTLKQLRPGQDIKFAQPSGTSQVDSVLMFNLMAMAAGVGCTYDQLSGDLRGANYSSLRAGKIDFRALVEQIQELTVIPRLCKPVWERFIARAILAGELKERSGGYPVEWVTPAWQSINPKFDEDAEQRSVRAGRMTPQQYMAGWGGNWRRNIRAFREFYDYMDENQVALEIDVRNYTRAGSKQPVPPGAPGQPQLGPDGQPLPGQPAAGAPANDNTGQQPAAPTAAVTLVDANGEPIDLSELQDAIDAADEADADGTSGRGLPGGPFEVAIAKAVQAALAEKRKNGHIGNGNGAHAPAVSVADLRRALRAGATGRRGRVLKGRGDFNEADHPRDQGGQFTDGAGSESDKAGNDRPGKGGGSSGKSISGVSGGSPRYVGGDSSGDVQGSGGLSGATIKATYSPGDDARAEFESAGATALTFSELGEGGAKVFRERIEEAKNASTHGAAVTLYPEEDYSGMRVFLADDGKVGFALKGDDIVSVFKHPDATADKACVSMLALAVEQGGRRLDCFDTALPHIYGALGFQAVARIKWNDDYAPEGWDKNTFKAFNGGEPDVVFMKWVPGTERYKSGDGPEVDDYDAGVAKQRKYRRRRKADRAKRDGDFDETEHPRDDQGQFTDKGGGDEGGGAKESSSSERPTTDKVQKEMFKDDALGTAPTTTSSFADANISIMSGGRPASQEAQEKLAEVWNESVGMSPATFKQEFTGGAQCTMNIKHTFSEDEKDVTDNSITVFGEFRDDDDNKIGEYTRTIDFLNGTASSDYLSLHTQGAGAAKQFLAANVAMYEKLGISSVEVHANIDVGGYAWAKYGYVPEESSWRSLQGEMDDRLTSGGGTGYKPEDWDSIDTLEQGKIEEQWKEDTKQDFIDSEVEHYHESGAALDDQKSEIATDFNVGRDSDRDWAKAAYTAWSEGETGAPSWESIMAGTIIEYNPNGEGTNDPQIDLGADSGLTDEQVDSLTEKLTEAFNDKAEADAPDRDAPDYIADNIAEHQDDVWASMDDSQKFEYADSHNLVDENTGDGTIPPEAVSDLRELIYDPDPKALWAIADSEYGKELLLGTDWYGALDLSDADTMDRFNAYIRKGKK